MADNVVVNAGAGGATVAADDVGGVHYQRVKLVDGTADSSAAIPGDATNGLDVDVTRLPSLPAGSANIGDVDIASIAAGDNNIGNVDVVTLPSIPAGTNNIGDVDVLSVPADPFGANADAASATGSISAKLRHLAAVGIAGATSLPAGTNNIGDVDVLSLPALAAGNNNIGDVDIASGPTGASALQAQGAAAHDAAVAGNPLLCGAEARTSNPTAVTNGDSVRQMADKCGRLVVVNESPRDLVTKNRITLSSTTETTLIAAGGAGVFRDLVALVLSNESATEVRVDIRDATGGTPVMSIDLAADGGGAVVPLPIPMPQASANNNWTAQLSAAVSTVYLNAMTVDRN